MDTSFLGEKLFINKVEAIFIQLKDREGTSGYSLSTSGRLYVGKVRD